MPNETNTVGATMEIGRLRIENEALRQQNAELVRALELIAAYETRGPVAAAQLIAQARAILATVQA